MSVNLPILNDFHAIKGLKMGIASAGIKKAGRKDIVVFELGLNATTAGVFTQNAFCAAPVNIAKEHLKNSKTRYLLINTGNANAGTGERGHKDCLEVCQALADATNVPVQSVLPFSTGVIGEPLPVDKIVHALPLAVENLASDHWFAASEGILTTDTQPKGYTHQFEFEGDLITVSGISKGAGMIMPNMATMLGFIATDAAVEHELLQQLCRECADYSFNRVTIDGDTSTNDACILMATGESTCSVLSDDSQPLYAVLKAELKKAFLYLAQAIVRDGEGATKFIRIDVEDCKNNEEALAIGYTVAHSPLVKTALYASDANWGRILAAVGRSGVENMDINAIQIFLDDVCIVEKGGRADSYTESAGSAVMQQQELSIRIKMGRGHHKESIWTSDLSHDYVSINADYRS